jgi:hypothetical protein
MNTEPEPATGEQTGENTDRELWREREGDYYADSIHVTKEGAIGINCGGTVIVKPLRAWHQLAIDELPQPNPATGEQQWSYDDVGGMKGRAKRVAEMTKPASGEWAVSPIGEILHNGECMATAFTYVQGKACVDAINAALAAEREKVLQQWPYEIHQLRAQLAETKKGYDLMMHKLITCGVIAEGSEHLNKIYQAGGKWDSQQAEKVRAIVAELAAIKEEQSHVTPI